MNQYFGNLGKIFGLVPSEIGWPSLPAFLEWRETVSIEALRNRNR